MRFSYWRGKKDHEVDLVAEAGGEVVPFEVKYRQQHTGLRGLKGMMELFKNPRVARGYIVTKAADDFGLLTDLPREAGGDDGRQPRILRVPAPLLCYWMGAAESSNDTH